MDVKYIASFTPHRLLVMKRLWSILSRFSLTRQLGPDKSLGGKDGVVYSNGSGTGFVRRPLINVVPQTSLWVSSTLSRMVFKEDMRWKASSCTGNCWGWRPLGR